LIKPSRSEGRLTRLLFVASIINTLRRLFAVSKVHKEKKLRKYELMMIFPIEEDQSKAGLESVKTTLSEYGVEIEKEDPFGDRDLCYEVKKRRRGRFVLFIIKANPAKIIEIESRFKLIKDVIKYLFVRVDE
jgi:small subunit ribosomal protein S6